MPLEFRTITVPIGETSGTFSSNEETTFSAPVRSADASIKQFKLDAIGAAQPSDIAQVGITTVSHDHSTVEFTVKARYTTGSGGKFTGQVDVLVIAEVAPVP
jgi:hypothetical protein